MTDDLRRKVEETLEVAERICHDWEIGFLESVQSQLASGRAMSEKQETLIESLYARSCRSPY